MIIQMAFLGQAGDSTGTTPLVKQHEEVTPPE